MEERETLVVLFDGVCNLCNGVVQFIIKNDPKEQFHFASLQSAFGQKLLKEHRLPINDFNSFILLENGKLFNRSAGALRVAKRLKGLWPLLYVFILVPPFIRDAIYIFVAKNRYKWFGRQDACWVPTTELKNRFFE